MSKPSILVMAGGTGDISSRDSRLLNILGSVVGMFHGLAIKMAWNTV